MYELQSEFNEVNANIHSNIELYVASIVADTQVSEQFGQERLTRITELDDILKNHLGEIINSAFNYASAGDISSAAEQMPKAGVYTNTGLELIQESTDIAKERRVEITNQALTDATSAKIIILTLSEAGILLSTVIALYISGIISNSIVQITQTARKIADEEFDVSVGSNDTNEIGNLSNSLLAIKNVASSLTADMAQASHNYTIGNFSGIKIDESHYKGAYTQIAYGINETTRDLINIVTYAIDNVHSIGRGNFDIEIREYPGDCHNLTDAFQSKIT